VGPEHFEARLAVGSGVAPGSGRYHRIEVTLGSGSVVTIDSVMHGSEGVPAVYYPPAPRPAIIETAPAPSLADVLAGLSAAGVHNYPETMCAIPRVMRSDFIPFHVDAATQTAAVVVPVAPRGSGDGRTRLVFAERGHPLAAKKAAAKRAGKALVLSADNPLSRQAFAKQR